MVFSGMAVGIIFWLLFLSATGYILLKGNPTQRHAIGIMIFGVVATTIAFVAGSHKWLPLNFAVLGIDIVALALFVRLAIRSNNIWPLLLVGWQLATVVIHLASSFAQDLIPKAYGIGQGIWAYLQFATILIATLKEHRRATRTSSPPS
jgi:hypothetical protein